MQNFYDIVTIKQVTNLSFTLDYAETFILVKLRHQGLRSGTEILFCFIASRFFLSSNLSKKVKIRRFNGRKENKTCVSSSKVIFQQPMPN